VNQRESLNSALDFSSPLKRGRTTFKSKNEYELFHNMLTKISSDKEINEIL